jgi:hypothetical protein
MSWVRSVKHVLRPRIDSPTPCGRGTFGDDLFDAIVQRVAEDGPSITVDEIKAVFAAAG